MSKWRDIPVPHCHFPGREGGGPRGGLFHSRRHPPGAVVSQWGCYRFFFGRRVGTSAAAHGAGAAAGGSGTADGRIRIGRRLERAQPRGAKAQRGGAGPPGPPQGEGWHHAGWMGSLRAEVEAMAKFAFATTNDISNDIALLLLLLQMLAQALMTWR